MSTKVYSSEHPIVFVFDFQNERMEVPVYDPESVVAANESCISVRTIADVDGEVTVTLASSAPRDTMDVGLEVFHGTIDVPSRKVSIVTSQNQKLIEMDVKDTKASVRVLVNEKQNPSRIWVIAQ